MALRGSRPTRVQVSVGDAATPSPGRRQAGAEPADAPARSGGLGHSARVWAAWAAIGAGVLFLIAVVIFTAGNSQDVSIRFVSLHARFPLSLCLLCAAAAGVVAVMQVLLVRRVRLRRADRRRGHLSSRIPDRDARP
jgi:uncharacterized integral membrane protein